MDIYKHRIKIGPGNSVVEICDLVADVTPVNCTNFNIPVAGVPDLPGIQIDCVGDSVSVATQYSAVCHILYFLSPGHDTTVEFQNIRNCCSVVIVRSFDRTHLEQYWVRPSVAVSLCESCFPVHKYRRVSIADCAEYSDRTDSFLQDPSRFGQIVNIVRRKVSPLAQKWSCFTLNARSGLTLYCRVSPESAACAETSTVTVKTT